MGYQRTGKRWRSRAKVAGLFVCLFVIRSLVHTISPAFVVDVGDGAPRGASTLQIVAACGTASADNAPTDERRDHSQCCIVCNAGARDATDDVIADSATVLRFVPPDSIASMVFFDIRAVFGRPSDCSSFWSSRAPPRV
jgi:hypothetical protein